MEKKSLHSLIAITLLSILTAASDLAIAQLRRNSASDVAPAEWYTFKGPDGDFTLRFPFKPARETETEGTTTLIRAYAINTKTGMRFSINFQDVGGDPRASQNNEWEKETESMLSAAARKNGERVVQIHRLRKNIIEMELSEVLPETGINVTSLRRSILWRGRVYILGCGSVLNNRPVDKSICQSFFDSMRFTGRPQKNHP